MVLVGAAVVLAVLVLMLMLQIALLLVPLPLLPLFVVAAIDVDVVDVAAAPLMLLLLLLPLVRLLSSSFTIFNATCFSTHGASLSSHERVSRPSPLVERGSAQIQPIQPHTPRFLSITVSTHPEVSPHALASSTLCTRARACGI